ncbi:MAG: hypothetical protein ACRELB_14065, partial [Polyangiaceae bacterium]
MRPVSGVARIVARAGAVARRAGRAGNNGASGDKNDMSIDFEYILTDGRHIHAMGLLHQKDLDGLGVTTKRLAAMQVRLDAIEAAITDKSAGAIAVKAATATRLLAFESAKTGQATVRRLG